MTSPPPASPAVSLPELVSHLGARYVRGASAADIFEALLPDLQAFTRCEAAFVGRLRETDGKPHLQLFSPALPAWSPPSEVSGASAATRYSICHDLQSLLGRVLTSGRPVIHNEVDEAQQPVGLSFDHPVVDQFMGIPLVHGGALVGVLALINRQEGFSSALMTELAPAVHTLSSIVGALALERAQREALLAQTQAQDQLQRHEDHYRQIFEAAGVGIALVSLQGQMLDLNQRFADICQRPREQLLGMCFQEITHPEDLTVDQALLDATLQGHRSRYSLDKRYLLPDGGSVWVQLNVVLVRNAQGQPLHFVSVIEDISERKRYQEALLTAQASERASKAKTEFLSRMSHELRTPLNAMLGFAQLLRVDPANPLNEGQRQRLAHIEKAGAHLLAMLTEVLDLSRIEAGSLPLSLEALSLQEVVVEAMDMVAPQAQQQGVGLMLGTIPAGTFVRADQLRLRQILVNLLSNAIKYNRPQGAVHVGVEQLAPHVIVSVQDTGQGMSPDQLNHLFEPFNRLGAERSAVEGAGIGLVIVKRLVGLMHGRLEVQSTPGVGTVFRMVLPSAESPQPLSSELAEAPPHSGFGHLPEPMASTPTGVRWRVLYAEDNPVNVELVRHVMHLCPQWQLEVATNGSDAIEQILRDPPDLLLLDMHLGDMTGLDVAEALSHHEHTAKLPKVILSADVMPDQRHAAKAQGFVDYLTKPLEVHKLMALLEHLGQTSLSEASP
jgi:PAS domain S-box-containing protein